MSVWRLWNQSWNIVATASSDEWIRWTSCLFSSIRPTAAFKRVWKMETKSYVSDRNWCDWRGTVSRPPNAPDPSLWEDQGISHELQSVSYLPSFNLISTFPRSCCCIHDETPQGKCEVPKLNVLCAPCDLTRSGGFTPDPGAVILCSGHFFSEAHMEHTLVHELMHMYDHCRFKIDWNNLRHHACSEVSQCLVQRVKT